ncbi:hypothetical protein PFISCL1PPCAC_11737, partial [Pristionchus fissidentatus]
TARNIFDHARIYCLDVSDLKANAISAVFGGVLPTASYGSVKMHNSCGCTAEHRNLLTSLVQSSMFKRNSINLKWRTDFSGVKDDIQLFRSLPQANKFSLRWRPKKYSHSVVEMDDLTLLDIARKYDQVKLECPLDYRSVDATTIYEIFRNIRDSDRY